MASRTLSGLSGDDEKLLKQLDKEEKELATSQEAARKRCRSLRTELQEREARVESFLRKRLHELETDAVTGAQDAVLDRAEESAQARGRLEREHREASDGAVAAAREVEALVQGCAEGKALIGELTAEEQKVQEQAATASLRVDQLATEAA